MSLRVEPLWATHRLMATHSTYGLRMRLNQVGIESLFQSGLTDTFVPPMTELAMCVFPVTVIQQSITPGHTCT
jgi:hypothetical protein